MAKGDYVGRNKLAYTIRWPEGKDDLRKWFKIESIKRGVTMGDLFLIALEHYRDNQSGEPSA